MMPIRQINGNIKTLLMDDIKMDGKKQAPGWFWIALALIVIGSIIAYIIFQNDNRTDQVNTEKQTTSVQAANRQL